MKILIIGFGQDAKILTVILKKSNIKFKLFVKPSTDLSKFVPEYLKRNEVIFGDALDYNNLLDATKRFKFTHIFNLAANSFAQFSNMNFSQYLDSNTKILINLISLCNQYKHFWLYHPLSSEILEKGKTKLNIIKPRNAYGISKTTELYISQIANSKGIKIFYPILFNHESCFRTGKFFTSKLLLFLLKKNEKELHIWNTTSIRDWGSGFEYMREVLNSAKNKKTGSGELGTSTPYSVSDFINITLKVLNINYKIVKKKNSRVLWELEDGRKIIEKERDIADQKRILIANKNIVKKTFNRNNFIHGKNLIKTLIKEFSKYKNNI